METQPKARSPKACPPMLPSLARIEFMVLLLFTGNLPSHAVRDGVASAKAGNEEFARPRRHGLEERGIGFVRGVGRGGRREGGRGGSNSRSPPTPPKLEKNVEKFCVPAVLGGFASRLGFPRPPVFDGAGVPWVLTGTHQRDVPTRQDDGVIRAPTLCGWCRHGRRVVMVMSES